MRILIPCFFRFFIFLFLLLRIDVSAIVPVPVPFTSLSSQILSLVKNDHSGECDALRRFSSSFTIAVDASMSYCGATSYAKTALWKEGGGNDCCSWDGVTCDPATTSHAVVGLDLSCSWLRGTIQSDSSLFSLPNLRRLNLAGNDFHGSQIPARFGIFTEMTHLNLSYSGFTGQVPLDQMIFHYPGLISLDLSSSNGDTLTTVDSGDLGKVLRNLTRLRELVLDGVNMSRVNPISLGNLAPTLTTLSLHYCYLQGTFPIDIFHLPNLRTLNLQYNPDLMGTLEALTNWSGPLVYLDLSLTKFQGPIPASIGNLTSMDHLDLSICSFAGSIPPALWKLTRLIYLDLSYNNFSGTVDFEEQQCYGNCSMWRLQHLSLGDCGVTRFPYFLNSSAELMHLDLAGNKMIGPIPEWFWRVGRDTLEFLDLTYNNFTGEISPSICSMRSLGYLGLSNNLLDGSLPTCLGNLSSLYVVDLSSNQLHGPLPQSLANCTSLWTLYIQANKFQGSVNENALPNQLKYLGLSINNFEGPLPIPPSGTIYYLISNNEFSEDIPRNYFCNTTDLEIIDLSKNRLIGTIPSCLMNCSQNLNVLNLQANMFHGSIAEFSLPFGLQFLILSDNSFGGSLPTPPPAIQYYLTPNNMFTGGIPHQICNATSLGFIDLSNNHLADSIPQCFGNVMASLTVFDLGENMFAGQIPEIFNLSINLQTIRLNQNGLRGEPPRSLANCENLEVLDIGRNELEGHFPYWLDTLPYLKVLSLRSNNFSGPVGSSGRTDRPFPQLHIFDLSNNSFSGPIPVSYIANLTAMQNVTETSDSMYMSSNSSHYENSIQMVMKGTEIELVKILNMFTSIDLSSNSFEGEIPRAIGDLKALKGLNFSHNNLTGNIPSSVGNLAELEWLDLSSNKLNGDIPTELAGLTSLSILNLSNNQLVGEIPRSTQFGTFTSDSFGGNPGLCGHPLPKPCSNNAGQTTSSTSQDEEETDSGEWIEWRAVLMGYGCGLAMAISAWYIMMETRRPWWLVGTIERWLPWIVEGKRLSRKTNRPSNNVHQKRRSRG